MNFARAALLLSLGFPLRMVVAEDLPKPFAFARYQSMMDRSPFAVATTVAPVAAPNFAKDLYIANAARNSTEGDMVTLASTTDKMFKRYLTTKTPADGYNIVGIEWSDKVGATKVTIGKDGQTATLSFNEALLRAPAGPGQNPVAQPGTRDQPAPAVAPPPAPLVPGAQPAVPGVQPVIPGAQPNAIKPMPVPTLPTPPPRVRGVIPRNPAPQPNAVQTPPPQQPEL